MTEITFTEADVRNLIAAINERLVQEHARGDARDGAVISRLDVLLAALHQIHDALRVQRGTGARATVTVGRAAVGTMDSAAATEETPGLRGDRPVALSHASQRHQMAPGHGPGRATIVVDTPHDSDAIMDYPGGKRGAKG